MRPCPEFAGQWQNMLASNILTLNRSSMTGSIVLRIAYGYIVKDGKDYYVDLAEELAKTTGEAVQPGRWLVDSFPIRMWRINFIPNHLNKSLVRHVPSWFPGAGFKRWAAEKRKRSDEIIFSPLKLVQEQMVDSCSRRAGFH
jgi:hypothetical protein